MQVLARAVEMISSLGWFFGSLFFDQLSGAADNSTRVRYRAAQLRCACSLHFCSRVVTQRSGNCDSWSLIIQLSQHLGIRMIGGQGVGSLTFQSIGGACDTECIPAR